nr:hypothetical protein [Tanacetum cinerariifolium]
GRLELARQVADLVLTVGRRGVWVDVTQPHAQLQHGSRNMPPQAQAQGQCKREQNPGKNPHALKADGQGLLELAHVQADAKRAGDDVLEGDLDLVKTFGLTQKPV